MEMTIAPGSRLGPYLLLDVIGVGGMGEVFRARDERLGRIVAIKTLPLDFAADPTRRERFRREAQVVSALSHPHIAALYDIGEQEGLHYLVMEHVDGESLAIRLLHGPIPCRQLLAYASQLADALSVAHRGGVVHRDIKPSNVLITKSGIKLVDFGVAGLIGDPRGESPGESETVAPTETITTAGSLVGTFYYMAPEQLEGGEIDARTDIFGLGVVMYEMATGRRPFEGASQSGLIASVLASDPVPITELDPDLPAPLQRAIARCLEKEPDDRWQSAADLATTLTWIQEGESSPRPRQRSRFGWLPWAAGALVLALGLIWLLWRATGNEASRANQAGGAMTSLVRFEIHPPAGTTFSRSGHMMAVSPDGRRVAFIAGREDEPERLWIRTLDSMEARELLDSEFAKLPFWSADSGSIGFVVAPTASGIQEVQVKVIDILTTGGAAQTLGRAVFAGGSWSREGLLVFSGRERSLESLATRPGAPSFSPPEKETKPEFHNWPEFLPDGSRFLVSVLSSEALRNGIYVASINGSGMRRLVGESSNGQFVPPGYLLYAKGSSLLAQPIDAQTFDTLESPVVLAESVAHNFHTLRDSFSASFTGVLAYREEPETELVWYDRSGKALGSPMAPGHFRDPVLSRDGSMFAVSRLEAGSGSADIWIHDLTRGLSTRLTFDPGWEYAPVWEPNDQSLVYTTLAANRYAFQLRRIGIEASGATSELIREEGSPIEATDWLEAVDSLIWSRRLARASLEVLALSEGGESTPLSATGLGEKRAVASPDGSWLAYVSDEAGRSEIYVRRYPAGQKIKASIDGGVEPRWRGDGRELFYVAPDRKLMSVAVTTRGPDQIVLARPVPLFATRMVGLTLGTLSRNQYDVTPEGDRFLVNQLTEDPPIRVIVNWPELLVE